MAKWSIDKPGCLVTSGSRQIDAGRIKLKVKTWMKNDCLMENLEKLVLCLKTGLENKPRKLALKTCVKTWTYDLRKIVNDPVSQL